MQPAQMKRVRCGKRAVRVLYSNVRGLRQAVGELRAMIAAERPQLLVLTETHLKGDTVEAEMLPPGYRVAARFDRSCCCMEEGS